jgi:ureidoacrylate peracid hydrolase
MTDTLDPSRTALLTIDLQNDFIHPDGAYGRAGLGQAEMAALPGRILPIRDALRARGGSYISAQFTLVPGLGGEPIIAAHLRKLRPFLAKGDFAPGSWGHRVVDALQTPDFVVEKVNYSVFYQSRMDWIVKAMGIETLIIGGIVTNGGVASSLRDAHLRDIRTILLTDGCAAFDPAVHEATLISLGSIATRMSCADCTAMLEGLA